MHIKVMKRILILAFLPALVGCQSRLSEESVIGRNSLSKSQQLIEAAFSLDVKTVKMLLSHKVDVNARMGEHRWDLFRDKWTGGNPITSATMNWTALQAVANSHREPQPKAEPQNTSEGLDASLMERERIAPEIIAERDRRRLEIAKMLIAANADLDHHDGYGATALASAIYNGYDELALLLIENGANPNTRTGIYIDGTGSITPLHRATKSPRLVKALIEKGAVVSAKDDSGATPLHWASRCNQPKSFRYLLAAGANPEMQDNEGNYPYAWVPPDKTKAEVQTQKEGKHGVAGLKPGLSLASFFDRKKAQEARQHLLNPNRKAINIRNASVRSALEAIEKLFDCKLIGETYDKGDDDARLKDIKVTIVNQSASLAETIAELCNQTGLSMHESFDSIGIYGAIGEDEVGGRRLTFAKDGILLLLSFDSDSMQYGVISAVPWYFHNGAKLKINEFVFPDGTRLVGTANDSVFNLPGNALARNQGKIKRITGSLTVQIPVDVVIRSIPLKPTAETYEVVEGNQLLSVLELEEKGKQWLLNVEWGCRYRGHNNPGLDYGHVEVLDANKKVMTGDWIHSSGGMGGGSNSLTTETKGIYKKYKTMPKFLEWTFAANSATLRIPVVFENCQVPEIIWKPTEESKENNP